VRGPQQMFLSVGVPGRPRSQPITWPAPSLDSLWAAC